MLSRLIVLRPWFLAYPPSQISIFNILILSQPQNLIFFKYIKLFAFGSVLVFLNKKNRWKKSKKNGNFLIFVDEKFFGMSSYDAQYFKDSNYELSAFKRTIERPFTTFSYDFRNKIDLVSKTPGFFAYQADSKETFRQ